MSTTESKLREALEALVSAFMSHTRWNGDLPIEIVKARAALALPASSGAEPHPDTVRMDWLSEWQTAPGKTYSHGEMGFAVVVSTSDGVTIDTEWGGGTYDNLRAAVDALAQAEAAKGANHV